MSTVHEHAERARNGIHAAALLALANHIADHLLPPPADIYKPLEEAGWAIDLRPNTITPWLNTLVIDEERNTTVHPISDGAPYVRSQWQVRLPANGTRFTITARRVYPLGVQAS